MNIITPQDRGLKFFKKPLEQAYVHQNYPSVRYCRDGRSTIVKSEEQDLALGADWAATPFPPAPKPAPAVEPTKTELAKRLDQLTQLYEELKAYTTEKQAENITLRTELAKLKAHPPKPEPTREEDSEPAEEAKTRKKKEK